MATTEQREAIRARLLAHYNSYFAPKSREELADGLRLYDDLEMHSNLAICWDTGEFLRAVEETFDIEVDDASDAFESLIRDGVVSDLIDYVAARMSAERLAALGQREAKG